MVRCLALRLHIQGVEDTCKQFLCGSGEQDPGAVTTAYLARLLLTHPRLLLSRAAKERGAASMDGHSEPYLCLGGTTCTTAPGGIGISEAGRTQRNGGGSRGQAEKRTTPIS
ncbi:hypothetical protein NDU88_004970 [Pleurodeles waltl]|uniref:Uncharacterized protein n=1 Tax=Pleurodeles waltl TaxID=8319 RepID=A0AAV7WAI1_PLEWA|nr:hypothetical protein NDU88_004970 [Pleurodeles waltl]